MNKEAPPTTLNLTGMIVFSFPLILAALFEPLASVVDTALVGQKNTLWLGGLALATTLFNTLTWMLNFLVHASTQSLSFVSGQQKKTLGIIQTSLFAALAVGIISALFVYFFRPWLYDWVGVKAEHLAFIEAYVTVRLIGHPLTLLFLTTLSLLRGLKEIRKSLILVVGGTILNIVFSWLALWVFEFGLGAVAFATVLSHFLVLILGMAWLLDRAGYKLGDLLSPFHLSDSFHFAQKSWHLFGRSAILASCFFLATRAAAQIGNIELAAYQISLQLWLFSSFFIDGVAYATTVLIAHAQGQDDQTQMKVVSRYGLVLGLGFGVIFTLIYFGARDLIIALFTNDMAVVETLHQVWPWIAGCQVFLGLSYVTDGLLFGVAKFRYLKWLMAIGALCFFLPFAWLAIVKLRLEWLWIGFAVLGFWRLVGGIYGVKKVIA